MTHLWLRAEQRDHERRTALMPEGAQALMEAGFSVTVEDSAARVVPLDAYRAVGCQIAQADTWTEAPDDVVVLGLKELDETGPDLRHRHIMFGHAFKGQADGPALLRRFDRGGGTLLDLEYLTNAKGARVAAFGYWAGFAGAAIAVQAWIAQQGPETILKRVESVADKDALLDRLIRDIAPLGPTPRAIVIGAKGRVGSGACDLFAALGIDVTAWDMAETKGKQTFPEIFQHDIFVNAILAGPNVPVFVPTSSRATPRTLQVVADVSCDPSSAYNPIPIYNRTTTFADPIIRVADAPQVLDVMAIDNLPSLLPLESSSDYAQQLLPSLLQLGVADSAVWARARAIFQYHLGKL